MNSEKHSYADATPRSAHRQPSPPPLPSPAAKYVRYVVAMVCAGGVIFWQPKEPPTLDITQMKVVEGVYRCIKTPSGRSGVHTVDGVTYYSRFSYLFGISSGMCFQSWSGYKVRLYYLPPSHSDHPLLLEVSDLKSGQVLGLLKEKQLAIYQDDVANKWPFFACKLGLLLLALRLTCWGQLKSLSSRFIKKDHHDITR